VEEKVVLLDRRNWGPHVPWVVLALLLGVPLTGWDFFAGMTKPVWPGGGSAPGFTCGVAGGLIILFELLFWWRKRVRTWRIGRAQSWMRAHIWFGLLCLPLLIWHSGFRLGGMLSTVLMVLLVVVVASGIWGLALQQFLPKRMLNAVPSETIYSQIDHVVKRLIDEAEALVLATCGPEADASSAVKEQEGVAVARGHVTIGAVRSAGRVQGKVVKTRLVLSPIRGAEPLRRFFRCQVKPYLAQGQASASPLESSTRAAALFQELRTKLDPSAYDAVEAIENACEQRRQFDVQSRIQFWLHNWLWLHLPLSVALVVLMVLHIVVALKYM
jgi:hypothetical protein